MSAPKSCLGTLENEWLPYIYEVVSTDKTTLGGDLLVLTNKKTSDF